MQTVCNTYCDDGKGNLTAQNTRKPPGGRGCAPLSRWGVRTRNRNRIWIGYLHWNCGTVRTHCQGNRQLSFAIPARSDRWNIAGMEAKSQTPLPRNHATLFAITKPSSKWPLLCRVGR